MRDYKLETEKRIKFIQDALAEAHADGIIIGNSGGKDSALVMPGLGFSTKRTDLPVLRL